MSTTKRCKKTHHYHGVDCKKNHVIYKTLFWTERHDHTTTQLSTLPPRTICLTQTEHETTHISTLMKTATVTKYQTTVTATHTSYDPHISSTLGDMAEEVNTLMNVARGSFLLLFMFIILLVYLCIRRRRKTDQYIQHDYCYKDR